MTEDFYAKLYNDRTYADVTFVIDGNEEKAHRCVLADRCDYFKQSFDQNKSNAFNKGETSMKIFREVVKFCYLQQIDITNWSYGDKQSLHKLATAYNYGQLIDYMKRELKRRPEVPLSVDTLNEWHKNSPGEELRGWIKNNLLIIANYEQCHEYSKDLIAFIFDILKEEHDKGNNKYKLFTVQEKLLLWLFRWRDWCNRDEEDVRDLFSRIKWPFVLKEWTSKEKSVLMKVCDGIRHFLCFRKVNTAGWNRDEVLKLLSLAHKYDFDQLFDAVLNVVSTQYLEPSSFAQVYGVACKLQSNKLQEVVVNYLRNNILSIINSAEFSNYSANVFKFILYSVKDEVCDAETEWLIITSINKWKNSNSEELKKVFHVSERKDYTEKALADVSERLYNDDHSKDLIFVFGKREIRAHKTVLASSCDYFKQLYDQNKDNRIDMKRTRIEPFQQVIKHCYMQKTDLKGWGYSEKEYLYDLATKYNYRSLMDLVKTELDKRPKVPLSAVSLNKWYENCPDEEIRGFVRNNPLRIVNYQDCHKYSKDLVVLIMDTFFELSEKATDKQKLETPLKKLLLWLFRWRNSAIRMEKDVERVFAKIRLQLVLKGGALVDKKLQKKLFVAVRRFCHTRKVHTARWTCDDILELLYFAHDYDFGPLVDALLSVVATQHLEPASLVKFHHLTCRLVSDKLQQIIVDYIKNHTMIILTSFEFTNYPASVVGFISENMSGQGMDVKVKNQLLTSLCNWKTSKSEEELRAVFTKIQWEDFSRDQLAGVLRTVIPGTCLGNISDPLAPENVRGSKRKQIFNSQCRRSVRLRKE